MVESSFYAAKARLLLECLRLPSGRVRRGVLQAIASRTGHVVNPGYLAQLARGRIREPSGQKMAALAESLGFPLEWWWTPVEAGPPPLDITPTEIEQARATFWRLMALPAVLRAQELARLAAVVEEAEASAKP